MKRHVIMFIHHPDNFHCSTYRKLYDAEKASKLGASNGFRSRRVSVLRCTRTGLFILGIGSGSSNRVSVDPELEIEPECGQEGLVPMRLVELRVAQSLGLKRPRNGRVPGRFCT